MKLSLPFSISSTFHQLKHLHITPTPQHLKFYDKRKLVTIIDNKYSKIVQSKSITQPTNSNTLNIIPHFISLTKTLTQNPKDPKTLAHLDTLLLKIQSFDSITSIFVFEGLCKLDKINRAKDILFHLKNNLKVSSFLAYSLVFDCLVKNGRVDDVEVQWGEIFGGSMVKLSNYVIWVCKRGDLFEVKRVCERVLLGSNVLDRQCYVALIGSLCRYNDGFMAKCVICEMYCRGFDVDDVSYVVLLECFCQNGDLVEADWVLRKMVMSGGVVDVCVYDSFMYGLCKVGKFKEANKLFNKLSKREHFADSKTSFLKGGRRGIFQLKCERVVTEMMAYEVYFRGLCRGGKLDQAEMLLKKMMKMRALPQICVYGCFIKALFRVGRDEDAMNFFHVECRKGLVCSHELARFVVMQLCVKGRVDDAIRIFNEFEKREQFVCVALCNSLLGCLWSSGKAEEAEAFYERMKKGDLAPPNPSTFKIMVCGHCDRGNLTKALDILENMSLKNVAIERIIYETIIRSLDEHGRRVEAYKYLNDMTKGGFVVSYIGWRRVAYPLLCHSGLMFEG